MAGWIERLYGQLPAAWDAAATIKGYLLDRQRYGSRFRSEIEPIRERGGWARERLEQYQAERLRAIVEAAARTRHYRGVFQACGLQAGDIRGAEDLRRLPMLDKQKLREDPLGFVDPQVEAGRLIEDRTSGTTGTPLRIFMTSETLQTHFAYFEVRSRRVAGMRYGEDPYVMFGARRVAPVDRTKPPFWCYNHASRQLYMSSYHLGPECLDAYCEELRRRRYSAVMGYPSVMTAVGRHMLARGIGDIRIPAAITQGETVHGEQREAIAKAFHCRVFEQYGCAEMCVFAQECVEGRLHVSIDYGVLEIVDGEGKPTPPGVPGHVVCTGLVNEAQPLIRYRLGDIAVWSGSTCGCGSAMPVLESVEGRAAQAIVLADGRQVYRVGTISENIPAVRECQIVQEAVGRFTILVAAGGGFTAAHEDELRRNLAVCVGQGALIEVRRCESVPRGAGGKFHFITSKVATNPPADAGG